MVTAIFGGSFDPPHIGHILVITAVLSLEKADEVIMVPCVAHPFGKATAPFRDRLQMCRLMVQRPLLPAVTVSDIERRKDLSGRTLDTLVALEKELPDRELRFLIGADILEEKDSWYRFGEIEKRAPLIVIGRGDEECSGGQEILMPVSAVSSTEIRERISGGLDCSAMVPASVLDYIEEKGLYR